MELDLSINQLTDLTLPPSATNLFSLQLRANPLTRLILPEVLATDRLADTVETLRSEGVDIFTYPLSTRLGQPQLTLSGALRFTLFSPPGVYTVAGSTNLLYGEELGLLTNAIGTATFIDMNTANRHQKFYRAFR